MMLNFNGKTAVVTGGSRGIGRSICLELAKLGANVAFTYNSNEALALKVKEELEELGVRSMAIKADTTSRDEIKALADSVYGEFGAVDFLINNAGVTADNLLIRMKDEDWNKVIDTNLTGVFITTQEFGKKMIKAKTGRIVNITSIVGIMGNAGQANYSASKAGVIGFTKSVAKEFSSRNVLVNAVAPGFIATDMTAKLSDDMIEGYKKVIPLGKMGTAQDIANTVIFLCSDMASYITGQIISVDGGMYM
jgi:3-oxoacyl-[acyl-carrier protein] reductase